MKNFLQRLIHRVKNVFPHRTSLDDSGEQSSARSFTANIKENLFGQLKKLKDSAKAKNKVNSLTTKSLPFSWDEVIGKAFSPAARPVYHKIFLVLLSLSTAYLTAKIALIFLSPLTQPAPSNLMAPPVMMSPPLARDALQSIKDANLFNAKLDEADDNMPNKRNKVELICERASKKSSLPIKLLQTTVMQDDKKSLASVEVKGMRDIAMLRTGESIESYAKLDRIERQRLIVKNFRSGDCEYIEGDEAREDSSSSRPMGILSPQEGNKLINSTRPSSITQDGNNFKIKKSYRDNMLQDIGQILTQARAVMIRNPDGTLSYQMNEVVPGSIYSHLNIQNGDIIKSINGEPIRDLNQLMGLFGNIKNVDHVQLGIVKDGQEQNMDFSFE